MNIVDLRTLALTASLSAAVLLLVPVFLMRVLGHEDDRSLRYWTAGAAALGVASLVLAIWGLDDNDVGQDDAILAANTLGVLGMGLLYIASRLMLGLAPGRRFVYPLTGFVFLTSLVFNITEPADAIRVAVVSACLAVFPAASAWLFLRHRQELPSLVAVTTAAIFAAISAIYVVRTVVYSTVLLVDSVNSAPPAVATLPFFIEVILNTWLAAMLAIIVSARVQARLRAERDRVAEANRQLLVLSTTDPLTGLANRNRVDQVLADACHRTTRHEEPVSVILLDIDYFKRINDDFGHPTGDSVLVQLAETLRGNVREVDTVGRWGGEEFIAVLPDTGPDEAHQVAERVRLAVADTDFGVGRPVTASLGVATHVGGQSMPDLVSKADNALYRAKRRGRNRVLAA